MDHRSESSPPINARAETVATAPMFRDAFARRCCLVPADLFYEWQTTEHGKQPFAVARADGAPLVMGGVWESLRAPDGDILRTYAIVTTPANAEMAAVHDRMPLVLERAQWPVWLGEEEGDPATMLRPSPAGTLRMWPVGRAVNSPKNNGPELVERFDTQRG